MAVSEITEYGFSVIDGPYRAAALPEVIAAYDRAMMSAEKADVRRGSTSLRVNGLLDQTRVFDALYTYPPLLQAAHELIGGDYKLSAFHARSLRPGAASEMLHQDVKPGEDGWPLLGFIFMVDPFCKQNGATRFLTPPVSPMSVPADTNPDCRDACGAAGSLILFDGSAWHGHGSNTSNVWRRSIQGALIPRAATSMFDHAGRIELGDCQNLSAVARRLLMM